MVVCGGLRWFSRFLTAHGHTDVLSSQILVVVCGGLRWCVVVCGGLWWFAVVCGGLWWIAVVCLLVIPTQHTHIHLNWLNNFLLKPHKIRIRIVHVFKLVVGMEMDRIKSVFQVFHDCCRGLFGVDVRLQNNQH